MAQAIPLILPALLTGAATFGAMKLAQGSAPKAPAAPRAPGQREISSVPGLGQRDRRGAGIARGATGFGIAPLGARGGGGGSRSTLLG